MYFASLTEERGMDNNNNSSTTNHRPFIHRLLCDLCACLMGRYEPEWTSLRNINKCMNMTSCSSVHQRSTGHFIHFHSIGKQSSVDGIPKFKSLLLSICWDRIFLFPLIKSFYFVSISNPFFIRSSLSSLCDCDLDHRLLWLFFEPQFTTSRCSSNQQ